MHEQASSPVRVRTVQALGAVSFTQIVSLVLGSVATIVLSRWLGPTGRGLFIFATMVIQTLGAFLEFGLPLATTTLLLRKELAFQGIVSNALFLALLRISMAGLAFFFLWLLWPQFHSLGLPVCLAMWGVSVSDTLLVFGKSVLFCVGDMNRWSRSEIGVTALYVPLLALSWFFHLPENITFGLCLLLFPRLCWLLYVALAVRKYADVVPRFDPRVTLQLLKFGTRSLLNNIVWTIGMRMDMYVVGVLFSAGDLGIYSLASGLSEKLQSVLLALPRGLYPAQAAGVGQGRQAEEQTARGVRLMGVLGILTGVCASLLAPVGIPLVFGGDYSPAITSFIVLSMNTAVFGGFNILGGYVTGRKMQPEISAAFGAFNLVTTCVATIVLAPHLGITGAAVGNLVSTVVGFGAFSFYFSAVTDVPLRDVLFVKVEDLRLIVSMGEKGVSWCRVRLSRSDVATLLKPR